MTASHDFHPGRANVKAAGLGKKPPLGDSAEHRRSIEPGAFLDFTPEAGLVIILQGLAWVSKAR